MGLVYALEAAMARMARVVVANCPHPMTQRGNRRQHTFFRDADCLLYVTLAADWFAKAAGETHSKHPSKPTSPPLTPR